MDSGFSIGQRDFKLNKLNAFKQFHVARRMMPLLADLIPAMKDIGKLSKVESLSEEEKFEEMAKFATPIMNGLSKLSDADSEFVLFGLLASVEIKQPTGNWALVANNGMLMMQDLELPVLLQLAGRAFMFNLSGFFGALPR